MPVFDTKDLLTSLTNDVKTLLKTVEDLQALTPQRLNTSPAAGKWTVIQVLEHLDSYNRYYLPEIEKSLQHPVAYNNRFKPGWFGDYFTKMMLPGNDGKVANKMNAPKNHTPDVVLDTEKVIREFIEGEQRLITCLTLAASADIGRLRVPISISRFIKLKLGDTFRFLIAHQQRHFVQIQNTLAQVQ